MADLDREIADALDAEDRALRDQFGEQGLFAQTFSVYQGKQGWIAIYATIASIVIFVGAFYSGWKAFGAEDTVHVVQWGAACWFLMTMVAFMKVWFWMRMESNRVIREIKRVELQVARLQSR